MTVSRLSLWFLFTVASSVPLRALAGCEFYWGSTIWVESQTCPTGYLHTGHGLTVFPVWQPSRVYSQCTEVVAVNPSKCSITFSGGKVTNNGQCAAGRITTQQGGGFNPSAPGGGGISVGSMCHVPYLKEKGKKAKKITLSPQVTGYGTTCPYGQVMTAHFASLNPPSFVMSYGIGCVSLNLSIH